MAKLLSAVCLSLLMLASAFAGEKASAAEAAALEWLSSVDAGDYAKSWDNAGALLKKQLTTKALERAVSGVREPLGALRSRKVKLAQPANDLPGAPNGEYVVLQFDSAFVNKAAGIETVTTVFEGGVWRVVGYFIR
ncbi:MAG: DUF4019 domain-containing protein [Burkholderiaceae bacterium]